MADSERRGSTHEPYTSIQEMAVFAAGILDLMGERGTQIAEEVLRKTGRLAGDDRVRKDDAFFFMPGPFYQPPRVNLYAKLAREPRWGKNPIYVVGFGRHHILPQSPSMTPEIRTTDIGETSQEVLVTDRAEHVHRLINVISESWDVGTGPGDLQTDRPSINIPDDFADLLGSLPFEGDPQEARSEFLTTFYYLIEGSRAVQRP